MKESFIKNEQREIQKQSNEGNERKYKVSSNIGRNKQSNKRTSKQKNVIKKKETELSDHNVPYHCAHIRLLFQVSATVFITIEDINDNTPIFQNTPYKTEISEVRKKRLQTRNLQNLLDIFHASIRNMKGS